MTRGTLQNALVRSGGAKLFVLQTAKFLCYCRKSRKFQSDKYDRGNRKLIKEIS